MDVALCRSQRPIWELNYIRILDLFIMQILCNINFSNYILQ